MDIILHNFEQQTFQADDDNRRTQPTPTQDPFSKTPDTDGPKRPDVERPSPNDLLKRMRRVDPDMAKKYRQRSGE